jgi:hypothetical protein
MTLMGGTIRQDQAVCTYPYTIDPSRLQQRSCAACEQAWCALPREGGGLLDFCQCARMCWACSIGRLITSVHSWHEKICLAWILPVCVKEQANAWAHSAHLKCHQTMTNISSSNAADCPLAISQQTLRLHSHCVAPRCTHKPSVAMHTSPLRTATCACKKSNTLERSRSHLALSPIQSASCGVMGPWRESWTRRMVLERRWWGTLAYRGLDGG